MPDWWTYLTPYTNHTGTHNNNKTPEACHSHVRLLSSKDTEVNLTLEAGQVVVGAIRNAVSGTNSLPVQYTYITSAVLYSQAGQVHR